MNHKYTCLRCNKIYLSSKERNIICCLETTKKSTEDPSYVPQTELVLVDFLTINCQHLDKEESNCSLASYIADKTIDTTPENCRACGRCDKPQDINEVTLALAGVKHSDSGPGTTLKNLISWFVSQPPNCGCSNRVQLMNHWGPERCLKEIPTILGWLRESALDSGYPYSEFVVGAVVKLAIKRHINSDI